jgi:uncharacterized membrane protein
MKIATGIIGLVLMLIVGVQSLLVDLGGTITKNQNYSQGGSVGVLVALLFLIAGAFAFAKPIVSFIVFILAGVLGLAVGGTTGFTDMTVWGVISLVLAVLSFFAWRGDKKKKRHQNSLSA